MAKAGSLDDLAFLRNRIQTQFVTTDLDPSTAEEEIASLAERTLMVKKRVTDEGGFLKDRSTQPYVELMEFLGAGGQYLVFKGKMHFNKIHDFSRLWTPLKAHELMEADKADLTKFYDYTKHLNAEAKKKGLKKLRNEVMAFLDKRKLFQKGMCAVKISFEDISNMPRAKRETFTIGMYHPNIVYTLTEGRTAGNRVYRVMELVPKQLSPPEVRKRVSLDQQIHVCRKVAEVLEFIDEKGAVHRDLKPENIMLVPGRQVEPKVADFGLMKLREFNQVLSFLTASSCMLLGTPEYIAPEQAENPVNADIRSDIYCLGATAYYWWTGHSPNPVQENVSPRERVHLKFINAINRETKPAPPLHLSVKRDFLSRKAKKYQTVLAGMLLTDPTRRYQRPREVIDDLQRILDGRRPQGRPEPAHSVMSKAFSPGKRKSRKGRILLGLTAAVLALAAGGYVALNELPKLRQKLPAWFQTNVPWYRK